MTTLAHIADRVLHRPLLVTPEKAQVILQVLAGRLPFGEVSATARTPAPAATVLEADAAIPPGGDLDHLPFAMVDGVAVLEVQGTLVNRGAWLGAMSGVTSYEGLQHQLRAARDDARVKAVVLDIDSPGGEAIGAMETAAAVRAVAAVKPVTAMVNGVACSAAYAIASGATEIATIETGVTGSIGVVYLHFDVSRQLAKEGVTPTLIYAGEHKVDGNAFAPLPDTVRADIQAEVDTWYRLFVQAVGAGRGGRLTEAAARATEARIFVGERAVAEGLADSIGTFDEVLAGLAETRRITPPTSAKGRPAPQQKGKTMKTKMKARPRANAEDLQEEIDTLEDEVATVEEDLAAVEDELETVQEEVDDLAEGETAVEDEDDGEGGGEMPPAMRNRRRVPEAAFNERRRVLAILDAAKGKPVATARELIASGTSAKAAARILATVPKAAGGHLAAIAAADAGARAARPAPRAGVGASKADTPEAWAAEWRASAKLQETYVSADDYVAVRKRQSARAA